MFKRQTTRYVENTGKRSHSLPASLAPLEIKNHASAMYWFKPLTFACHRIPEKNGHIKVITSAYATLTCPFSPDMGQSSNHPKRLCRHITAALVSILPVIAFIILTRPIHACSHYSFRSAANKAGRAGNWILEFSAYPGVCILSTRVRMWRMLIRHRRTRVSESKQTTDM